jgi:hypothetical protein
MVKSVCLFVLFALFSVCVQAQVSTDGAQITFEEKMKEYGDIKYGDSISYTFKFKNTGNDTLVIKNVVTTCSCTSRKYTEGPILPGQSGELVVKFDSSKQDKIGRQNKVITILSNALNNPERVILAVTILEK